MIDRAGHDYKELLKFQDTHLSIWRERVLPHIMDDVEQYVREVNLCAKDSTEAHRVYRGQTIIELIRTWPRINEAVYAAPHKYPSQRDAVESMI